MKFGEVLAKSNPQETLQEHTIHALHVWRQLRERYYVLMPDEQFWKDSYIAVLFHDFGKNTVNFQMQIRCKGRFPGTYLRHEFISGLFLFFSNPDYYSKYPHSVFAVFAHHKAFTKDLFLQTVDLSVLGEDVSQFVEWAKSSYREDWGMEIDIPDHKKVIGFLQQQYEKLLSFYQRLIRDKLLKGMTSQDRLNYLWHKAILHECDWTASGHKSLPQGFAYSKENLADRIVMRLNNSGSSMKRTDFSWREFQSRSLAGGGQNVLAIAPTGSGKTEASLLWALTKEDESRIIYLLPTRVTSNAIYTRLQDYFSESAKVALVHSSAVSFRKGQEDVDFDKKEYLWDKSFFKNITVCTVDQMLTQGFNFGHWELKTFHFLNARVIIDEIHLYSPYTLALIIRSLEYLKESLGAKFFLMSATMPSKLRSLLSEKIGDVEVIEDRELLARSRNIIETRSVEIPAVDVEVKTFFDRHPNGKLLMVVNSVDRCIGLFENYHDFCQQRNINLVCYHSRFIQEDRKRKESQIFQIDSSISPGFLIATQVVEVSLDVDFDILFTENAPIDAIIQRAGRVNRKGSKGDTKVVVCMHGEISEKIYGFPGVLSRTFSLLEKNSGKRITEGEFISLVDQVYADFEVEEHESYLEGLKKYDEVQRSQFYVQDFVSTDEKIFTRENLDSVTIIPMEFHKELWNSDDWGKKDDHSLSISRKRYLMIKSEVLKDEYGHLFAPGAYSLEKGFVLPEKKSTSGSQRAYFV